LGFPPTVPIIFSPAAVSAAVVSLLLIGPIGGLVSVRYSLKVEPLTALGLAQ
jgi:putative ABC transport system permease protein